MFNHAPEMDVASIEDASFITSDRYDQEQQL